jgi:hypothetical protein
MTHSVLLKGYHRGILLQAVRDGNGRTDFNAPAAEVALPFCVFPFSLIRWAFSLAFSALGARFGPSGI